MSIAYIWTALGDKAKAFENLDRAVHDRDPNLLGLKSNPIFDSLRGDEHYDALLRKMQLDAPALTLLNSPPRSQAAHAGLQSRVQRRDL